jgi:hypothetical protein
VRERLQDLGSRLDRGGVVQLARAQGLSQRLAGNVLVGDVDVAAVALEAVGAQAALVSQAGGCECFAFGARRGLALARDDLEGDFEPRVLVACEPDRSGAAAPERAQGPIALSYELARRERKRRLGHDTVFSRTVEDSCQSRGLGRPTR